MDYSKRTYVYKTMQGYQIHADVYKSKDDNLQPCIIFIHGGGLIFGNRGMLPPEQVELYIAAGYTIISIDYRLAPETKLKDILEDVQDAYQWVYNEGPNLFMIDSDRIAIIGHSSGGYLALMAGFSVHPRPKALVSFYGYGDISGEWYSLPDPNYIKEPAILAEVAYQGVGGSITTGTQMEGPNDKRWIFYQYCRQQGLLPKEITGHDPQNSHELLQQYCPVKHIYHDYPPTLLLHGDQDKEVPFEQSIQMSVALKQENISHRLIIMEGLGHIFDITSDISRGPEPGRLKHPKVMDGFNAVLAFLHKHFE